MNEKSKLSELIMSFCICTTGITILEGVLGMLLYPDEMITYKAFFSPPLFALFSVLLGVVTWSKKELSVNQVLIRQFLHLVLIELMVFGTNYLAGYVFPLTISLILAVGIAVVFIAVYVILWLLDRRSAMLFNAKLKQYKESVKRAD